MKWAQKQKGFTIVELLIVVVVIAILAAITIVAYNGITSRANDASAATATSQAIKQIEVYYIQNGEYPPDEDAFLDLGFRDQGATPEYTVNNSSSPKGFCVTMTVGESMYYGANNFTLPIWVPLAVTQAGAVAGKCPGHYGSTDGVKNFIVSPSVEVTEAGYGSANGATHLPVTTPIHTGARSLRVTMPQHGSLYFVGVSLFSGSVGTELEANTKYFISAHVYVPSGTVDVILRPQGAGRDINSIDYTNAVATEKNEWVRIWASFETTSSGSVSLYLLNNQSVPTAGTVFYVDDSALRKGVELTGYSDNRAPSWSWTGSANNSASEGPSY